MRKLPVMLLLMTLLAGQASALNISNLLSTIAMPLAVAAVSDLAHVPEDQLATFASALNQANVPPAQFVRVVRYVPVALVDQNGQPFIAYVRQETEQGVTGDALATAIADHLQSSYGVTPELTTNVPAIEIVERDYVPQDVLTRLGQQITSDPLAIVTLPLAVAAVSNIAGVSQDQLANIVATLNQADVPVTQEIDVIRYVPVALVADNGPPFVQFVQQQVADGVTGPALVPVIYQQLQTYYPAPVTVAAAPARTVVVDENFVPRTVVTRITELRANPHGGPPGQIKKQLGLQTGAEVVHGKKPGRQFTPVPVATVPVVQKEHGRGHRREEVQPPMASSARPQPPPEEHGHGRGHEAPPAVVAQPPIAIPVPAAAPPGPPPGKQKGGKGHGKD